VDPDGVAGVLGGVSNVTESGLDHPEVAPLLSVAIALTRYVPALLHWWDEPEHVPELSRPVIMVVPSPQLKVYLTRSPSGSVVDVE
jgi:hypothetical protein